MFHIRLRGEAASRAPKLDVIRRHAVVYRIEPRIDSRAYDCDIVIVETHVARSSRMRLRKLACGNARVKRRARV